MNGTSGQGLRQLPARSFFGLNAANFFQAEMVGVILPVLNALLKSAGWRYDAIGVATAVAGLGTLLFQGLAGWLTDRLSRRRLVFAAVSMLTGVCFVLSPSSRLLPFGSIPCCSFRA